MTPPVAERILSGLLNDPRVADAFLGDLAEGWAREADTGGPARANRWYWVQAARSVPHLMTVWWRSATPGARIGLFTRAATSLLCVPVLAYTLVVAYLAVVVNVLRVSPAGRFGATTAAVILVLFVVSGVVGGIIAARAQRTPPVLSILATTTLAATIVLYLRVGFAGTFPPSWLHVTLRTLLIPALIAGGFLALFRRRGVSAAVVALLIPLTVVRAQGNPGGIVGTARNADTGGVLPFALVRLIPTTGASRQGVTSSTGTFFFAEVAPGEYRVQLLRIGYAPVTVGPIHVTGGAMVRHDIYAPSAKLLATVVVRPSDACLRGTELARDAALALLWEEARTGIHIRRHSSRGIGTCTA